MKPVLSFLLFQLVWIAAVAGAGAGSMLAGPAALLVHLALHLAMVEGGRERLRELRYALAVGLLGGAADSVLRALEVTAYPTSPPGVLVPPWIVALWVAFALLPRYSLAWLRGRPAAAALLGAVGGPLSYLAGTRFEAVAVGAVPAATWIVLALQYALFTPVLLRLAPAARPARSSSRAGSHAGVARGSAAVARLAAAEERGA